MLLICLHQDERLIQVIDFQPAKPPQACQPEEPKRQSYADEIEEDLAKMAQDLGLEAGEEEQEEAVAAATASAISPLPAVLENIPKLDDLLRSKKPSDSVAYNLLNILYP